MRLSVDGQHSGLNGKQQQKTSSPPHTTLQFSLQAPSPANAAEAEARGLLGSEHHDFERALRLEPLQIKSVSLQE